ncbi:MAG TPA: hypothetical protein VJR89_23360 [Polyangiales bacterium]|nr:hypothetical protein [Polyangiales bacterium]
MANAIQLPTARERTSHATDDVFAKLRGQSLIDTLRGRRARRFARGMRHDHGPLRYASEQAPLPLCETELAALAFAACGVTGPALAELVYRPGWGGTMMAGLLGRTASSADAVQSVSVVVTNDEGTYLLKRPQDFAPAEIPSVLELTRQGRLVELYQRSRIRLSDRRAAPSIEMPINLDVNRWSLYQPGTTYFLPVNEYTYMYINGLLEFFNRSMGVWVVDERRNFRPAGLQRFAKSRGGHLHDAAAAQRTLSVERLESLLSAVVSVEQGMVLQNLGLMAHAMGLGGFPNFAAHEFAWFDALGFRMAETSSMQYLGARRWLRSAAQLLGKDSRMRYPLGLERDGEPILVPYAPPYYESMREAVLAVVERKFGARGVFRGAIDVSGYKHADSVARAADAVDDATVQATIAYCEYLYATYGRFPVYPAAFRTGVGFQAAHLDLSFYDRYYRPEALGATQREHMQHWHGC